MISDDPYGILHRLLLNQPIVPSPEGVLRTLGFIHVYSASGLHLIALEAFLQRFLGKSLASKKILTLLFLFFLILIWKLQNYSLGFARVLVLFFLRALAREKGFRWRVYYPLFLAVCFDFAMGIDSGWQHYYLAILGGMLGLELAQVQNCGTITQHLYLSVGSWLMTAPLDLWQHHLISWMTPIWSMITIPVIALFLYPLSVISYFLLDRVPLTLMNIWNHGVEFLLKVVDQGFTFSVVNDRAVWVSLLFAVLAASIFVWLKRVRDRGFWVMTCILIAFLVNKKPEQVNLVQLDVGQGDSLLVTNHERTEMIDLGTSREVKPETMMLHLAQYGVTQVNTVLFSHLDEDHAGGVRVLLPWVPTEHLEMSSNLPRTLMVKSWLLDFPQTSWCERGCFKLGNVDWVYSSGHSSAAGNDLMATTMIPLSSHEIYLALGDADSHQEELFWKRHHVELESYSHRILKLSHHGSKLSSSADFLRKVSPTLAVISVGRHNHYHHPHFRVVNQLIQDHIPIHRTDQDGDYVF